MSLADDLVVATRGDVAAEDVTEAVQHFLEIERYVDEPLLESRFMLRRDNDWAKRPFVVEAHLTFAGRVLAVHTAAPSAVEAAEAAVERLRRRIRSIVGTDVGLRNERRVLAKEIEELEHDLLHRPEIPAKPPEARRIIHRGTEVEDPLGTLPATAELLDMDLEFLLFQHVRTMEDVVVHRRDDPRIGLIFPPGSVLADENDVVAARPSRYDAPLSLQDARDEMDLVQHRYLYFQDVADGRGKVLYLRHDGDYGLVEPFLRLEDDDDVSLADTALG